MTNGFLLLSRWGSFLAFDAKSKALFWTKKILPHAMVRLEIEGTVIQFTTYDDKGNCSYLLPVQSATIQFASREKVIDHYSLVPRGNGLFSIEKNGFCLSASRETALSFRPRSEEDEVFWLYDEVSLAHHLLSGPSWFSSSLRRIVQSREIELIYDFRLKVGEIVYSLSDIQRFGYSRGEVEIYLIYERYKVERLELYRPLIYFVAYGHRDAFSMLSTCIASLERLGKYKGDYLIITDRPREALLSELYFVNQSRILVENVVAVDVIDMVCARFKIGDMQRLRAYQPVLYSDFDVICNSDIDPLLERVFRLDQLCLKTEGAIDLIHYGSVLIEADAHSITRGHGFNSGIIAFRNVETVRPVFQMVINSLYSHLAHGLSREATEAYDQPVSNYVIHKLTPFDTALLDEYVHPWPPLEDSEIKGKGLVHFCGGVGPHHKVDRIRNYYNYLLRQQSVER